MLRVPAEVNRNQTIFRMGFPILNHCTKAAILACAVVLTALSGYVGWAEYKVSDASHDVGAADIPRLAEPAFSIRSIMFQLSRCGESQTSLRVVVYPSAIRRDLARDCLRLAQEVLDDSPTLAVAHFALAASLLQLGTDGAFQRALDRAWVTAPNEGWLAARRVDLALSARTDLSDENSAHLAADLALLLVDDDTRGFVAETYFRTPKVRETILQAVERQPPARQRRFVDHVNALALARESKT